MPAALVGCSDDDLARRLRAKRLGVTVPSVHEIHNDPEDAARNAVRATLLSIEELVTAPWDSDTHPFERANLQPHPAPRIHREMGSRVLDYFGDHAPEFVGEPGTGRPMTRVVRLDDVLYERSSSSGRNEQALNEVRWYLDGQLAIAWNVVVHRKVIETWNSDVAASAEANMTSGDPMPSTFNVERMLPKCVRVHAMAENEIVFRPSVSVWDKETLRVSVTISAKVKHGLPMTVWGNVPVVSGHPRDADRFIALIAELSARQQFTAYA